MTRETVFFETLARRAMSLIVALRPGLMPVTFGGAVTLSTARLSAAFFRVRVMWVILRQACASARVSSANNQRVWAGLIGTVTQRRLPIPVNMASAVCPAPME